ncbi:MAG: class I SAM-dependent methyltransferase, partial [Candidatus Electrothrix sp.]
MHRVPEPELMEGEEQGLVYAQADFSGPNRLFLSLFAEKFPQFSGKGEILDLGCGPADILIRFARTYPDCTCVGVDGSEAMLAPGRRAVEQEQLAHRIALYCRHLPCLTLPHSLPCSLPSAQKKQQGQQGQQEEQGEEQEGFQVVLSNSLLHHLHNPEVLWQTVQKHIAPGGSILIMDLFRPESTEAARCL